MRMFWYRLLKNCNIICNNILIVANNIVFKSISICDCNNAIAIVKLLVMVKCCRKKVFADANILRRHILPTQKLFATLVITSPLLPSQSHRKYYLRLQMKYLRQHIADAKTCFFSSAHHK